MRELTPVLPSTMKYDKKTKTLIVEYTDGSKIKYFDIDPKSLFLLNSNSHAHADFMAYVKNNDPKSEVLLTPTKPHGITKSEPKLR